MQCRGWRSEVGQMLAQQAMHCARLFSDVREVAQRKHECYDYPLRRLKVSPESDPSTLHINIRLTNLSPMTRYT